MDMPTFEEWPPTLREFFMRNQWARETFDEIWESDTPEELQPLLNQYVGFILTRIFPNPPPCTMTIDELKEEGQG